MWTARRILKELADTDRRRRILTSFWKHAETHSRLAAQMQLSKALNFREETIRKMPPEKKADLMASRIGSAEFDQFLEMGLMAYHTTEMKPLLGAFLDQWKIPHEDGTIEADEYATPTPDQVQEAVTALESSFDRRDMALYLASAGLLMGGDWREATTPAVDRLAGELSRQG